MSNQHKNSQTPPLGVSGTALTKRKGPIATSTRQIAGYFTVSGIQNEISLPERDRPRFALKELLDNAYDWLNDYYPAPPNDNRKRYIGARIRIDKIPKDPNSTRIFRLTVRNSNVDQIEAFTEEILNQIFDFTQWTSTKRDQNRMTAGELGDYLKRHAGMAYASWTNIAHRPADDEEGEEEEYTDEQVRWEEPMIFRFNGKEYHVFVYYNRYTGEPKSEVKYAGPSYAIDYTEVECTLPVSRNTCKGIVNDDNDDGDESKSEPLFDGLHRYYKIYKPAKRQIKFSLDLSYDQNWKHVREED
jgi:hypothetical protein